MKINTVSIHFTADRKLVEFIETKLGKLEQYYDRIIDARVTLKLENNGQVRDKEVGIQIRVPGDVLISKERSKTFEAAADMAIETMKRQIKRFKNRVREKSK